MRIRSKLLLIALPVVVLPAALIGLLAWHTSSTVQVRLQSILGGIQALQAVADRAAGDLGAQAEARSRADCEQIARQVARGIEMSGAFLERVLDSVAPNTLIESFVTARAEERTLINLQIKALFNNLVSQYGYSEVSLLATNGMEMFRVAMSRVPPGGDPEFDSTPLPNQVTNESAAAWFIRLRQQATGAVSRTVYFEPDFDPENPEPVLSIACPLKYKGNQYSPKYGATRAYLRMAIPVSVLCAGLLHAEADAGGGEVVIADERGTIVASSNPQRGIGTRFAGEQAGMLVSRAPALDGWLQVYLLSPLAEIQKSSAKVRDLAAAIGANAASLRGGSEDMRRNLRSAQLVSVAITLLAMVLAAVLMMWAAGRISRPLGRLARVAQKMAERDLQDEAVTQFHQQDQRGFGFALELDVLAAAIGDMVTRLADILRAISGNAVTLSQASQEISGLSAEMAGGARETSAQAANVNTAGQQLLGNMSRISGRTDEISQAASSLAREIAGLGTSLNEVAHNCANELQIAREATRQVRQTRDMMGQLGAGAKKISHVVELINEIAAKTKLLALNATIEAASAGDAGRGFAVVAGEVKDLARQSAQATSQIVQQITSMQQSTEIAIAAIQKIAEVIENVEAISGAIAAAAEQQSATVGNISRNVTGVSQATGDLAQSARQSETGAREVSHSIDGINQAAAVAAQGAEQGRRSAENLAQLAGQLKEIVSQFKM